MKSMLSVPVTKKSLRNFSALGSVLGALALSVALSACTVEQEAQMGCKLQFEGAQERACLQGVTHASRAYSAESRFSAARVVAAAQASCGSDYRNEAALNDACKHGIELARLALERQQREYDNPTGPRY